MVIKNTCIFCPYSLAPCKLVLVNALPARILARHTIAIDHQAQRHTRSPTRTNLVELHVRSYSTKSAFTQLDDRRAVMLPSTVVPIPSCAWGSIWHHMYRYHYHILTGLLVQKTSLGTQVQMKKKQKYKKLRQDSDIILKTNSRSVGTCGANPWATWNSYYKENR